MHAVRPTRASLIGSIAAIALAVALTGCASDDSGSADDPAPAAASSSTSTDETPTPTPTDESSPIDDGAQVDVAAFVKRLQAGIDNTDYAHIDFAMGGAGGEMKGSGDVDYTVEPPNMQMSMELGPQTIAMLLVDKTMYVQAAKQGGKYLAYDLSDPNNPLGSGLSEQLDPAASIETFTKAVSSVTSSGKEDVDGRTLSRYVLTVDTSQLPTQSGAAGLPPEMQIVVWLDDQDRMAQTSMAMGPIQYDATLSGFDKPVELEAPPKDQVVTPPGA